jgi:hypothetical protein
MEVLKVLPLAISGVALFVSVIVAIKSSRLAEVQLRYISRNHYMNALFDIDRQMLNNPSLWAIFDSHPLARNKSMDAEEQAKRQAFLLFHLNLFDNIYEDYQRRLKLRKRDREYWESWNHWIKYVMRSSSEARDLFFSCKKDGIYPEHFLMYMSTIIEGLNASDTK